MITEVHEEESGKAWPVKGECAVCQRTHWYSSSNDNWIYNMVSGLLHVPSYHHEERTACGKDATGKTWLWRL